MFTRRHFLKLTAALGVTTLISARVKWPPGLLAQPRGSLDPLTIPKYVTPLIIPPAMPRANMLLTKGPTDFDYYRIAVRQFSQHILPSSMGLPPTTVWSYTAEGQPQTFNYPAFTIEARYDRPVRIKWINGLVDAEGRYLPHLLPVDQTLHWANPPGGEHGRDMEGRSPQPYTGPAPIVTHVHGAHVPDESDGYAEAWYLPSATNIHEHYAREGTWYEHFRQQFRRKYNVDWEPGSATFHYPNRQDAATLWYHDHTLGITRLNVYAGPAGFYLLRGGPGDEVTGVLPGPAPALGDPPGKKYYEIPIAIQDRSFNDDGSLFYPDHRAFFEELTPEQLQIPFTPDPACGGPSDVPPIWNPEFFGETIVVNGRTWPYLDVEPRRYRFRFLNGCNSRFLILRFNQDLPFYQIGSDGGFLSAPVRLPELLMSPAERADVIVDFTALAVGTNLTLLNLGPDEPFGGGAPGEDFEPANPQTTGQVMQFRVIPLTSPDPSTPPMDLVLPTPTRLGPPDHIRQVSLNEEHSHHVLVSEEGERIVLDCEEGEPFGPTEALLGTVREDGAPRLLSWDDPITENPALNATEVWEIHNFTVDAHPIHIHEVMFEVVNRENKESGVVRPPEPWETGLKDTVIAYPNEITRVKARFEFPGRFVWHCHILEHEDNEMMRPYHIGQHKLWLPLINKDTR